MKTGTLLGLGILGTALAGAGYYIYKTGKSITQNANVLDPELINNPVNSFDSTRTVSVPGYAIAAPDNRLTPSPINVVSQGQSQVGPVGTSIVREVDELIVRNPSGLVNSSLLSR